MKIKKDVNPDSINNKIEKIINRLYRYGAKGIRVETPGELDKGIQEMIDYNGPVIFDCVVDQNENVYPMIPSGKAHNEMLLGNDNEDSEISDEGKVLV